MRRPPRGGRRAPRVPCPGASARRVERARLIERTKAGLARARRQGTRLGRRPVRLTAAQLATVADLPVREAAQQLGVSVNTYQKARRLYQQTSATDPRNLAQNAAA